MSLPQSHFSSNRKQLNDYLFSFSVALEHKGTEGHCSLLLSLTPVSPLHHETHEPAVLLMRCELSDVPELELTEGRQTQNGSDRRGKRI